MADEGNTKAEAGALADDDGARPPWGVLEHAEIGPLALRWNDDGLLRVDFAVEPTDLAPDEDAGAAEEIPSRFRAPLVAYLRGETVEPATIPVVLTGTPFQVRVWTALRRVGRGQVRTYGGLARDVGSPRSMRAVGMAMATNPLPIVVPCHRVVAAKLELGGFSGGLERKRWLLELEGVAVDGDRVRPGQLGLF